MFIEKIESMVFYYYGKNRKHRFLKIEIYNFYFSILIGDNVFHFVLSIRGGMKIMFLGYKKSGGWPGHSERGALVIRGAGPRSLGRGNFSRGDALSCVGGGP